MTALAPVSRPSSSQLLRRILDTPDLPAQIEALEPAALGRLIDRIGLADAGEIVALATTEQLVHVFDDDLWKAERPGEDERFDADRFVVWLEIMLEAGESFVAARLLDLPEDLLTLAFHREILVLRLEELLGELREADEDEVLEIEKALDDCLYEELDEFQVVSRHHEGWDAILTSLLALDQQDHGFVVRLLERCYRMSADQIEDSGGLYEVLTSGEMLEADVAGDREDRRAEAGHVAPSAAKAFLELARSTKEPLAAERDALTQAYFRDLSRANERPAPRKSRSGAPLGPLPRAVAEAIADERVQPAPRQLAGTRSGASRTPVALEDALTRAMRALAADDVVLFGERSDELAYVVNVLIAGCGLVEPAGERRLRPFEAMRAAIATCNLGIEQLAQREPAEAVVRRVPLDRLFSAGWRYLHEEVARLGSKAAREAARDRSVGEALATDLVARRGS